MVQINLKKIDWLNQRFLKAIAYGNHSVYFDYETISYGLPNIIKNQYAENSDIVPYILLKWFINKIDINDPYKISNQKSIDDFYRDIKFIYHLDSETLIPHFEFIIDHYLKHKILEKTYSYRSEKYLYTLMPRGITLWENISLSSVLIDIYRDDLWLDQTEHSNKPTMQISLGDRLFESITYCNDLLKLEKYLQRSFIDPTIHNKYFAIFGHKLFTHHVYDGILNSIRKIFGDDRPKDLERVHKKLSQDIGRIEKELNNGYWIIIRFWFNKN